jgi:hypothetical protein
MFIFVPIILLVLRIWGSLKFLITISLSSDFEKNAGVEVLTLLQVNFLIMDWTLQAHLTMGYSGVGIKHGVLRMANGGWGVKKWCIVVGFPGLFLLTVT